MNSIAADASLQLDLRSVSPEVLGKVSGEVEELVNLANQKGGQDIHVSAEVIGERPAGEIPANHILVLLAKKCYAVSGMGVRLNIGSTDANEPLSRGYPAICVGLTTGGCSHTTAEYIDAKPVGQGLEILVNLVQTVFRDMHTTHNI